MVWHVSLTLWRVSVNNANGQTIACTEISCFDLPERWYWYTYKGLLLFLCVPSPSNCHFRVEYGLHIGRQLGWYKRIARSVCQKYKDLLYKNLGRRMRWRKANEKIWWLFVKNLRESTVAYMYCNVIQSGQWRMKHNMKMCDLFSHWRKIYKSYKNSVRGGHVTTMAEIHISHW